MPANQREDKVNAIVFHGQEHPELPLFILKGFKSLNQSESNLQSNITILHHTIKQNMIPRHLQLTSNWGKIKILSSYGKH